MSRDGREGGEGRIAAIGFKREARTRVLLYLAFFLIHSLTLVATTDT